MPVAVRYVHQRKSTSAIFRRQPNGRWGLSVEKCSHPTSGHALGPGIHTAQTMAFLTCAKEAVVFSFKKVQQVLRIIRRPMEMEHFIERR